MTDKVALSRQGEIFVMQRMMENGWKFPKDYHENLEGLDWVFEKNGRTIKIQVKTSLKKYPTINIQGKRNFDFLIFTNLEYCLIIPIEVLADNSDKITKTFMKLKNKFILQELLGVSLLSAINDCGISFSEINRPSLILRQKVPANANGKQQSLKVPANANGKQQSLKVPANANGKQQSLKVPANANGKQQSLKVPANANGKQQSLKVPANANGKQQSLKVPANANGKQQSLKVPANANGKQQSLKVPANANGKQQSLKVPANANGKQQSLKVPANANGKQQSLKVPANANGKQQSLKVPAN